MADPVITVNDVGQIATGECKVEHDTAWTATGADTLVAGTIMARLATGKWGIFDDNGAGVLAIAKGVLLYDAVATGAGDVPVDVCVRGTVNQDRLVIDDGGTVDADVLDGLRATGILAEPVKQLSQEDNQP